MDENLNSPMVSVLMPVFNASNYLHEAIQSILNQTFRDFEFIIINDGSTDQSESIIRSYSDERITYIKFEENKGLIYVLNEGIKLSKGIYIARMDADDICFPERLKKQISFLENNPDVGVLGTWFKSIPNGDIFKRPESSNEVNALIYFNNPLAHPTVMMRKDLLLRVKGYAIDFPHAEDYELWSRLVNHTKITNLPEVLLEYRLHDNQVSIEYNALQRERNFQVKQNLLEGITNHPMDKFISIWKEIVSGNESIRFSDFQILLNVYDNITLESLKRRNVNQHLFKFLFRELIHLGFSRKVEGLTLDGIRKVLISKFFINSMFRRQLKYIVYYFKWYVEEKFKNRVLN